MTTDPFATLAAPRRFTLDLAGLEKTYRDLSRALHPDKFAQGTASERRAALEKASDVNEAWRILRDPIRRAEALFSLASIPVGETNEPPASPAFLMEMMEERESLGEARSKRDFARVRQMGESMRARRAACEAKLAQGADRAFAEGEVRREELVGLVPLLGELRFYRRFLDEVMAIEEEEDAS